MDAILAMSDLPSNNLQGLWEFMKSRDFKNLPVDKQQAIIMIVRETAPKVGKLIGEFLTSRKESSCPDSNIDLEKEYREKIKDLIDGMMDKASHLTDQPRVVLNLGNREKLFEIIQKILNKWDTIIHGNKVKNIENMLLEEADISNRITLNGWESSTLFYKKAFSDLFNMQNDHERCTFIYNSDMELGSLAYNIYKACAKQPLALLLVGGLLSLKPTAYNIWKTVKDELDMITEPNDNVTADHMGKIFSYCYNDLPYFLRPCFLYFACYPIGFEIPATSLTQIWIAEGFVEEEDKQTSLETTANKYLDELVQRSLVFVSRRSLSGTIKSCRLHHSIHEFVTQQSYKEQFSVANPDQEDIETRLRIAIYPDNKKQCMEVKNNHIRSILAFDFDRNVLESAIFLKVLALRNSAIPVTTLPNMIYLQYLGLRGSNISELPKNIGDMENLQTLDVRDTSIETLPESLWNIKTLRHVYVKPNPQTKGPPSTTHIDNLHTLKTVAVHKSWLENIPHFLVHLRKLALSNWDNLDWKSISKLLSHTDNLISMTIMGKNIPSKFVDLRVFPNLETVKSMKLYGEWSGKKLFIDNINFPPNLTKLTLTKSGLKEDPMPILERLQVLKFLSLQDGAYIGKQMVCSTNGFPQLQFLELSKLENLEIWVVGWKALLKLSILRLVHCRKLKQLPNFHFVTINDIDDDDIDDHCWKPNQLPNFHFVINDDDDIDDDDIDDNDDDIDDDIDD
ncbi:inactive disease susceptibility protein LOV1-like [Carex rostrata]